MVTIRRPLNYNSVPLLSKNNIAAHLVFAKDRGGDSEGCGNVARIVSSQFIDFASVGILLIGLRVTLL